MTDAAGPLHELVTFAVFLDYRARRMRAPVVPGDRPTPDSSTTPQKPPPPASFDSAASRRGSIVNWRDRVTSRISP